MKRTTARGIHSLTNITYWYEKPNIPSDGTVAGAALRAVVRALPFGVHDTLKEAFFDTTRVIAVNGETVVVPNGRKKVDKFMFRYPDKMSLDTFYMGVIHEVGTMTTYLADIALPTRVGIKPAYVFRSPNAHVHTVVQTQARLNLDVNAAIDPVALSEETHSPRRDRTARDLATLLGGIEYLVADHGYYPDLVSHSGNLRRSLWDGSLTLIDVMPFYEDGSRLIGDRPPGIISNIQGDIQAYQEFVGQYGG